MAKFLDTMDVSSNLSRMIKGADDKLWLISPYLKIGPRFREMLADKDNFKIDIRIVYGKQDLQPDEINWLRNLVSVKTSYCKNLHAKCYLNEKEAIITSMNLYEFSQQNNHEMGILVSKNDDEDLYNNIFEEARRLLRISDEIKLSAEKIAPQGEPKTLPLKSKEEKPHKTTSGFCIRCKTSINLVPKVPYCRDCYYNWKKDGNEEYTEEYCHICGKNNKTSKVKPACIACYHKNAKILDFPI